MITPLLRAKIDHEKRTNTIGSHGQYAPFVEVRSTLERR